MRRGGHRIKKILLGDAPHLVLHECCQRQRIRARHVVLAADTCGGGPGAGGGQ